MASARETAVNTLVACRKGTASAEAVLRSRIKGDGLDARDAALASKLCFGVLQNRALLDFYLGEYSHTLSHKLEPRVLAILRVSAYQLVFLSRIPPRAAVDEAVKLTKQTSPRAAGLVNAVLRKLAANRDSLPEPVGADTAATLAVRHSHPRWLVERFLQILGETGAAALLEANNADVPVYAQVNTLRTDTGAVRDMLEAIGVEAAVHPWLPDCLELRGTRNLETLEPFAKGLLYIQDPAAKLAVLAAAPRPGGRLLDACAAPGGKSFAAGIQMDNTGTILAADIREKKLDRIRAGAERLGITILRTEAADAREIHPRRLAAYDTVLVDVPCSGMGIIRKKPEIRYKTPEEIAPLPEIQRGILEASARCVAPGGVLLYATCTVLPEENGAVVRAFLEKNREFEPEPFSLPGEPGQSEGMRTLYPHIHGTDGFFFCKMRRVRDS